MRRKTLTRFRASLLHPVPRVLLKPPMPMDQSTCVWLWSESKFCYYANTKAKISGDVFRPQKGLRSHLRPSNFKKFSWGSMPPDPPSLILRANARIHANSGASVGKPNQSNFCFRRAWHVGLKTSVNVITVVALCLHVGVKLSVCGYYSCVCFSMHVELKTSVNVVMLQLHYMHCIYIYRNFWVVSTC